VSSPGFDYESAIWGSETLVPGERTIAGFRLREALRALPTQGRVLEVGCGAGRFLRALARMRPGLELVGCDLSRGALARLSAAAPDIEIRRVEAAAALPAADAEFDAVLALDVLEHLESPDAMLEQIRRVLVPGGAFHLHVPCEGDPLGPWRWLPGQRGEHALKRRFGGHVQHFRRRELLARLERAGFEVVRLRYSLHLLGGIADVVAFAALAVSQARGGRPRSTGDLVAGSQSSFGWLVRAVDAILWCEATLLSRVPSWAVHVSARRVP
jgi:SAM-dependent methyltransferase